MAKMVNATFASQNQGVIITRQMWHLPCLPVAQGLLLCVPDTVDDVKQ